MSSTPRAPRECFIRHLPERLRQLRVCEVLCATWMVVCGGCGPSEKQPIPREFAREPASDAQPVAYDDFRESGPLGARLFTEMADDEQTPIETLTPGMTVKVLEERDGWCRIETGDRSGWVNASELSRSAGSSREIHYIPMH